MSVFGPEGGAGGGDWEMFGEERVGALNLEVVKSRGRGRRSVLSCVFLLFFCFLLPPSCLTKTPLLSSDYLQRCISCSRLHHPGIHRSCEQSQRHHYSQTDIQSPTIRVIHTHIFIREQQASISGHALLYQRYSRRLQRNRDICKALVNHLKLSSARVGRYPPI